MQTTLVIGSNGSIGKRYCSIIKYEEMGNLICRDTAEAHSIQLGQQMQGCTNIIVAVPTHLHVQVVRKILAEAKRTGTGYNILCEKPVSILPYEIMEIADAAKRVNCDLRMVCNWAHITRRTHKPFGGDALVPVCLTQSNKVFYNNFHTGSDGLYWDCIQLIYLDNNATLRNTSPYLVCDINGTTVTLDAIAHSYVTMLKQWYRNPELLWDMKDAQKATEAVIERICNEQPS